MAGTWTIATFNANSVRARLGIILDWLAANRPDLLCLQETKVPDPDFPAEAFEEAGYIPHFHGQKSYNGVAVLSLRPPAEVIKGFGDGEPEPEARLITVQQDGIWVINSYVPQGQDPAAPAFAHKLAFFRRLHRFLKDRFRNRQRLIWTGDFNVAPEPLDVFDPKRLEGKVGFHPDERAALKEVVSWGLKDLFRQHHPQEKQFTFWDYRLPKSFARNLGWRIDHMMATAPLARACSDCWVDSEPRTRPKPSDHTFLLARFRI